MAYELQRLRLSLPAVPESVGEIRHRLVEFAREIGNATGREAAQIGLAVTEASTNVVLHAFRDRAEPGDVHVDAFLENGALAVAVVDEGVGLAPRIDSPGLGLGLALISSLATSVHISGATSDGGGTSVLMHFQLGRAG